MATSSTLYNPQKRKVIYSPSPTVGAGGLPLSRQLGSLVGPTLGKLPEQFGRKILGPLASTGGYLSSKLGGALYPEGRDLFNKSANFFAQDLTRPNIAPTTRNFLPQAGPATSGMNGVPSSLAPRNVISSGASSSTLPAETIDPATIGSEMDRQRILAAGLTPASLGASAPPILTGGTSGLQNYTYDTLPKNASVGDDGKVYENITGKVLGTYTKPNDYTRFNPPAYEGTVGGGIGQDDRGYYLTGGNGEKIYVPNDPVTGKPDIVAAQAARDLKERETGVIAAEAKRRELFEKGVQSDLEKSINEETAYAEGQKKTLGNVSSAGRAGSMGFSSAEQGIIQGVEESSRERIASLNKEAKDAIRNFDTEGLARVKKEIADERQLSRERENTLFGRLTTNRQLGLQEKAQTATEANQVRDNALNTANTLFSNIKEGSLDATKLDEKQLATIEQEAGLPTGTLKDAVKKMGPKGSFLGSSFTKYGGYIIKQDENGNIVTDQIYGALPSGGTGTGTNLTTKQQSTFLRISDNYQKNRVINLADKALQTKEIADRLLADPGQAAKQISTLYNFIKALDPDSAVREGEIALSNGASSYLARFGTALQKIAQSKAIPNSLAIQLAQETKYLADLWIQDAEIKRRRFAAQAQVSGIKDAWDEYLGLTSPATEETDQYADYRSQVGDGEVLVERDGEIGAIPANEVLDTDIKL